MGDGWTIDDLLDDYPQLAREQIAAAIEGGAGRADRGSETAGAGLMGSEHPR
jgi:uncharacterized protein (DUF433 family)